MANTKIPIELSSTPGIVDNSTTTAMTIDGAGAATFSGNVGIGGAATDATFHVKGTGIDIGIPNALIDASFADASNSTGLVIGHRTDETTAVLAPRTATGNIAFHNYNGGWSESMRITNTGNVGIGWIDTRWNTADNRPLKITSNNEGISLFEVTGLGNVGIGISSPTSKLSLYGIQAAIDFQRGTGDTKWELSSDSLNMYISEMSTGTRNYVMALSETGNVGIGIVTPATKLNVDAPATDRETIRISTYYSPIDNLARGGITWHDGAAITGQIDTRYTGTTVDMHIGSLYSSGYNTTSKMIIKGSGPVTMPYQPSFNAYHAGDGYGPAGQVWAHNTVRHNVGGHFSTSTFRFTAPVSGLYHFDFHSIYLGVYSNGQIQLRKNGTNIPGTHSHFSSNNGQWKTINISSNQYLNIGDYIDVYVTQAPLMHGNVWNEFSGYLIG
jgi:hypothetical protein